MEIPALAVGALALFVAAQKFFFGIVVALVFYRLVMCAWCFHKSKRITVKSF